MGTVGGDGESLSRGRVARVERVEPRSIDGEDDLMVIDRDDILCDVSLQRDNTRERRAAVDVDGRRRERRAFFYHESSRGGAPPEAPG